VSNIINMSGDIRALSPNEIEAVAGGLVISVGALNIAIGEGDMVFGVGIVGVGSFGLFEDGEICGAIEGGPGGCTGRPRPA
jgi:hypothetical protein